MEKAQQLAQARWAPASRTALTWPQQACGVIDDGIATRMTWRFGPGFAGTSPADLDWCSRGTTSLIPHHPSTEQVIILATQNRFERQFFINNSLRYKLREAACLSKVMARSCPLTSKVRDKVHTLQSGIDAYISGFPNYRTSSYPLNSCIFSSLYSHYATGVQSVPSSGNWPNRMAAEHRNDNPWQQLLLQSLQCQSPWNRLVRHDEREDGDRLCNKASNQWDNFGLLTHSTSSGVEYPET